MQAELDRSARDSFRKLQQSSSSDTDSSSDSSEPVLVSTAAGLREAVGSGARDIRITNHLDLTGMQGFGVLDQGNIPGWQLRSIRVCISSSSIPGILQWIVNSSATGHVKSSFSSVRRACVLNEWMVQQDPVHHCVAYRQV